MFAEKLLKLIDERGISRYKIAQDTKITEATLSNYCNGKGRPNPSLVKQLAEYFEVDYSWLMEESAEKNKKAQETGAAYKTKNDLLKNRITELEYQLKKCNEEKRQLISVVEKLTNIIDDKFNILFPNASKAQNKKNDESQH